MTIPGSILVRDHIDTQDSFNGETYDARLEENLF